MLQFEYLPFELNLVFYAPALSTQKIQAMKHVKGHRGYTGLLNTCY